jgi:ligand-binding sensor domain-containing protein
MPLQNGHKQFSHFLLVWVLLFVLKPGISQSQPEEYIVESIPFTGELSGFHGTCMLQDREGFMWFGSNREGLCRYDERSYKMYRHIPGDRNFLSFDVIYHLISNTIRYLLEDSPSSILYSSTISSD